MNCNNCGIEFTPARSDAKYCSKQCKKQAFHKRSVGTDSGSHGTDNVMLAERIITEAFEFTVPYNRKPGDQGYDPDVEASRKKARKALYWYDVPLAALPVLKKDWPKMPDYMNGRQYFLWWKNEFEVKNDTPVLHNPFK